MAFLDRIRTRLLGERPDTARLDKALADLHEAHARHKESCDALVAACRADRAASIRQRRAIRASIRRMRAESAA